MRMMFFAAALWLTAPTFAADGSYAVVVSQETNNRPAWARVVTALVEKHDAEVIEVSTLQDALAPLKQQFPRYACFVARPDETTREFVAEVHRLTRTLDDDPYTDLFWGILTGFDAENALRIAEHREPLIIKKSAAGTEIALSCCKEGLWYCELNQRHMVRKEAGEDARPERAPADTTAALVDTLNEYHADLFVTSGHATERDWQIGFRYINGQFVSRHGALIGLDTQGKEFPVNAPNPKVYLAVGNCLMGHINGPDSMALAFLNSAGVHQMVGYTVLTWFGYGGWGCLDYFVEQPGRYTLTEAFFANHQALLHRLETEFPELAREELPPGQTAGYDPGGGLLHDRDVVAFYGDPAWEARMAPGPLAWEQSLTEEDGVYTFTITPKLGEKTFEPINTNGSQRGWRPIVHWLPQRVKDVQITGGEDLKPVITDNFVLVPNPRECDPGRSYQMTFRAMPVE